MHAARVHGWAQMGRRDVLPLRRMLNTQVVRQMLVGAIKAPANLQCLAVHVQSCGALAFLKTDSRPLAGNVEESLCIDSFPFLAVFLWLGMQTHESHESRAAMEENVLSADLMM